MKSSGIKNVCNMQLLIWKSSLYNNESFLLQLFLNRDDLNSGLYEGEVKGRRRFGSSQVPHGVGTINYFTNDKYE